MFAVTYEDAIAIHRAHQQGGDDAALAEVRRRWPDLAERVHREVLDRMILMKVKVPSIPTNAHPPSLESHKNTASDYAAASARKQQWRLRKKAERAN